MSVCLSGCAFVGRSSLISEEEDEEEEDSLRINGSSTDHLLLTEFCGELGRGGRRITALLCNGLYRWMICIRVEWKR